MMMIKYDEELRANEEDRTKEKQNRKKHEKEWEKRETYLKLDSCSGTWVPVESINEEAR